MSTPEDRSDPRTSGDLISGHRISGHRGAAATHPENTLAGFRAAIAAGAGGIEFDVRMSRDGVPVVIHDDTVDRTTNGDGQVRDVTAAELAALDTGAGEGVPTLAEVLTLAAGRVEANIELKDPDAVPVALELAAAVPGLHWFASSFDWVALRAARRAMPDARLYPTGLGGPLDTLRNAVAFAHEIDAEGLSLRASRISRRDIARIRRAGLRTWLWTVNEPARAAELLDWGADVVCTDDPTGLLGV